MIAAIYSRKSKYTGSGESVENQIKFCMEYGMKNLNIDEKDFIIYEDEGFSGSNTNRPEFQKMLWDIKKKKINVIICYRLDRISRNVLDFLNLIEILNKENIAFVSIREQFDTTTPMGRAMMYIASVFAQLERETIAERIRDNMIQLAKTGRWLGGNPPTGFRSEYILSKKTKEKEKKEYRLVPIEKEIILVKEIYNKFLQYKSLAAVERYLSEHNIKTKNGKNFSRQSIKMILKNPVYAKADKDLFKYLKQNKYNIYAEPYDFNGKYGIIAYNKTKQGIENNKITFRDIREWIIAVGKHEGIIPGKTWIEAQNYLQQNKNNGSRKVKNSTSLLSGLLICKKCGSYMRAKTMQRYDKCGQKVFYYICEKKEKSKKKYCQNTNLNGNIVDEQIMQSIREIMLKLNIGFIKDELWEAVDIAVKRSFLRAIINKILWDGEKIDIILYKEDLFPQSKFCK